MSSYLKLYSNLDKTVKRERKFWLKHVVGEEGICQDFKYLLEVASLERLNEEEIGDLLGDSVTIEMDYLSQKHQTESKHINGMIYHLKELGLRRAPHQPDIWQYELEIGPWFRQLEHVKDCRIFQKGGNNSMKIISELLLERGFRDFRDKTGGKHPARAYSVIYNETLHNYIRRICLEDGIIWRYEHKKQRHELIFHKQSTDLPEIPDLSRGLQDGVVSFCQERNHIPIKEATVSAYDWENSPVKNVLKSTGAQKGLLQDYHYPADFKKREEGEQKAERRLISLKSHHARFYGESTLRNFTAGATFKLHAPTLKEHHQHSFLIKQLKIEAGEEGYRNSFEALPAGNLYYPQPEKNVNRPVIVGTQTAVVVGNNGKGKINTNKWGQVKVRFHWDHHSAKDAAHTSAHIRVSSPAAGSQRGFVFTPRIGEEVVVTFEEGNPEKPLILGGVYSHSHLAPNMEGSDSLMDKILDMAGGGGGESYSSPVSQLFTGTIKSDADKDSNRLTFNDKSGKENLEINAKKDLNITVGHDLNIEVEDDIFIMVNQENIDAKENVKSQAGGSIINGTLAAMCNTAGTDISHMALAGIINIAGGVISNMAGATITNTAILSVKNQAAGSLTQEAATLLANTSLGAVLNMAENISQEGDLAVTNISLADIMNNATSEIKTKSLITKVQTDDAATTDTGKYVLKGLLPKIN